MTAEPSQTYWLIWQAVRERQHTLFDYDGRARDVCPVILGYAGDGREALKAFQVGGATSGGSLPAWRDFYLDRLRAPELRPGAWRQGESHKRAQTFVKFVDVDVNIPHTLNRQAPLPFGSPFLLRPRQPEG